MGVSKQMNPTVYHPGMNMRIAARGLDMKDVFYYEDDFFDYYAGTPAVSGYVESGTDSPVIAVGDAVGGILTMATAGANNNEGYLSTMRQAWIFNTTKRVSCEARIKLSEIATNVSSWCFGFSDKANGDDTIRDDDNGIIVSFDGALLYKIDGTMEVHFCTSNAGTQTNSDGSGTSIVTPVSGQWYRLYIDYDPNDGVTAKLNAQVYDETGATTYRSAEHKLTISGLQEMNLVLGVKEGGAGAAETLHVDYIRAWQER